jgi:hypothetical protein
MNPNSNMNPKSLLCMIKDDWDVIKDSIYCNDVIIDEMLDYRSKFL